jgi:hypothetical protein
MIVVNAGNRKPAPFQSKFDAAGSAFPFLFFELLQEFIKGQPVPFQKFSAAIVVFLASPAHKAVPPARSRIGLVVRDGFVLATSAA